MRQAVVKARRIQFVMPETLPDAGRHRHREVVCERIEVGGVRGIAEAPPSASAGHSARADRPLLRRQVEANLKVARRVVDDSAGDDNAVPDANLAIERSACTRVGAQPSRHDEPSALPDRVHGILGAGAGEHQVAVERHRGSRAYGDLRGLVERGRHKAVCERSDAFAHRHSAKRRIYVGIERRCGHDAGEIEVISGHRRRSGEPVGTSRQLPVAAKPRPHGARSRRQGERNASVHIALCRREFHSVRRHGDNIDLVHVRLIDGKDRDRAAEIRQVAAENQTKPRRFRRRRRDVRGRGIERIATGRGRVYAKRGARRKVECIDRVAGDGLVLVEPAKPSVLAHGERARNVAHPGKFRPTAACHGQVACDAGSRRQRSRDKDGLSVRVEFRAARAGGNGNIRPGRDERCRAGLLKGAQRTAVKIEPADASSCAVGEVPGRDRAASQVNDAVPCAGRVVAERDRSAQGHGSVVFDVERAAGVVADPESRRRIAVLVCAAALHRHYIVVAPVRAVIAD